MADAKHDGLTSVTELFRHVGRGVRAMTRGAQTPAMEGRFGGTLFAVR